jgi:hypothetical protein
MTYDPAADIEASINFAYQAIRQRIANGGPTWVPKQCDCDYCTGHLTGTLGRCIGPLREFPCFL